MKNKEETAYLRCLKGHEHVVVIMLKGNRGAEGSWHHSEEEGACGRSAPSQRAEVLPDLEFILHPVLFHVKFSDSTTTTATMSQEEVSVSRKEKKAQRDAERREKGKKRKHAETEESQEQAVGEEDAKAELKKKSKKRKAEGGEEIENTTTADKDAAPKPKKRKKASKPATADGESNDATEKTAKSDILQIAVHGNAWDKRCVAQVVDCCYHAVSALSQTLT